MAFSVVAHELAHGYAALHEGDPTALRAGRLTWNPLRHVDKHFTTLALATFVLTHGRLVIGGAKPVPINPARFRDGDRSDVLVSLAGIAANALIALVCAAGLTIARHGIVMTRVFAVNVALMLFNLLPIPPLDGWRVARCILRRRTA